ncbi:MAG: hypothetical protein MHPSP_001502, partial [Paramarteilia canceri]
YRRYANLFICFCTDEYDNELETMLLIHSYVIALDRFFTDVCEYDLMYKLQNALTLLDEIIFGGHVHEVRTAISVNAAKALDKQTNDEITEKLKAIFLDDD